MFVASKFSHCVLILSFFLGIAFIWYIGVREDYLDSYRDIINYHSKVSGKTTLRLLTWVIGNTELLYITYFFSWWDILVIATSSLDDNPDRFGLGCLIVSRLVSVLWIYLNAPAWWKMISQLFDLFYFAEAKRTIDNQHLLWQHGKEKDSMHLLSIYRLGEIDLVFNDLWMVISIP